MALGFGGLGNVEKKLMDLGFSEMEVGAFYGERPPGVYRDASAFTVTLLFKGRRMTTPFFTGSAIRNKFTLADVVGSLVSDYYTYENASGFKDWAAEVGMDTHDRSAKVLYRSVERQTQKLKQLLGDDIDKVADAVSRY